MNIYEWARKWGVSYAAVLDLKQKFGTAGAGHRCSTEGESEAAVQNRVRLEASRVGARVWRNNVGATYTKNGDFIRYGLANDSQQMNKIIKSSDLIGLRPVLIRPHHVGQTLGVFLAREVKAAGWRYTGTEREVAQLKFLELVASLGGDAAFANSEGTISNE
jgi:hypothetical protein